MDGRDNGFNTDSNKSFANLMRTQLPISLISSRGEEKID
jgi:hypothetical protein